MSQTLEKELAVLIKDVVEKTGGCTPEELAAAIVAAGWRNPTRPHRERGGPEKEKLRAEILDQIIAGTFISSKGDYQKDLALRSLKRHGLITNNGSTRSPKWVAL